MRLSATSIRRTALAEKVYAKAAEVERIRRQAEQEKRNAEQEARERQDVVIRQQWPRERVTSIFRKRTARDVLLFVCKHYGFTMSEMVAHRKYKTINEVRQIYMYLAYEFTDASFPQIGYVLNRDHTSVLYGWRKIRSRLQAGDAQIVDAVRIMRGVLSGAGMIDNGNYWGA